MFYKTLKNITLGISLILGLSTPTFAETLSGITIVPQTQSILESDLAQTPRRDRKSNQPNRKSKPRKAYFGLGLGVFIPSEVIVPEDSFAEEETIDFSTGFAISVFGGYKFSENFSGEIEIFGGLGNVDFESSFDGDDLDLNYSAIGIYLNPRVELPLDKEKKIKLYASPGLGISFVSTNFNDSFDNERINVTRDTGFSYQVKGGASYRVGDRTNLFGQVRYANLFLEDLDNLDGISAEIGVSF